MEEWEEASRPVPWSEMAEVEWDAMKGEEITLRPVLEMTDSTEEMGRQRQLFPEGELGLSECPCRRHERECLQRVIPSCAALRFIKPGSGGRYTFIGSISPVVEFLSVR